MKRARLKRFCQRQGWYMVVAIGAVVLTNILAGGKLWTGVGVVVLIAIGLDLREEDTYQNLREINRLSGEIWAKDEQILMLTGGLNATTAKAEEAVVRMSGMKDYATEMLERCEGAEGTADLVTLCRNVLRAGYFTLPGETVEYDEQWLIAGDAHHG